jgi:tRNA threonylcarbamoyladenosine biosynthesis protein TsaE
MMHRSKSAGQTERIGAEMAQTLRGGECIALEGELGAGKTQFARGLVRGLGGAAKAVSSPTFVLLNIYEGGRLCVYHLDAYRVGGSDDFEAIGFEELLEQGGVVIVEWASRVSALLPPGHIRVSLRATGPTLREIEIADPRPTL